MAALSFGLLLAGAGGLLGLLRLARQQTAAPELVFLAMGDWGGTNDPLGKFTTAAEKAVAKAMGFRAGQRNAPFTLTLGDNFYYNGIVAAPVSNDFRFQYTFEEVFTSRHMMNDDHFRVVAGNHDHYGNATLQVEYSERSKRWHFPSLYYTFTEKAPDGSTLQVVMIDTVVLTQELSADVFVTDEDMEGQQGGECSLSEPSCPLPSDVSAQTAPHWAWLEVTLAASDADYLVVAGHYPVWSVCEHGPTTSNGFDSRMLSMLEKFSVTAYFAGHDHCAEHISDRGVEFHGVGAAHGTDSSLAHIDDVPEDSLLFHWAPRELLSTHGAFALIEVSRTYGFVVKHYAAAADDIEPVGKLIYTAPPVKPRVIVNSSSVDLR